MLFWTGVRVAVLFIYARWLIFTCRAETHWVITPHGTIEPKEDSLLLMGNPSDFIQLLEQEYLVDKWDRMQSRLHGSKEEIQNLEDMDDPDVEKRVLRDDPDCLKADGRAIGDQDLRLSTWITYTDLQIDLPGNIPKAVPSSAEAALSPKCGDYGALDYSMAAMDHLEGVQERSSLKSSIVEMNLFDAPELVRNYGDIVVFGHSLSALMKLRIKSWEVYYGAALFWRMTSNPTEAIECLRHALHHAPSVYQYVPLLCLANVLHASGRSEDALVAAEAAVNAPYSPPAYPQMYYTLGVLLAVNLRLNDSVSAFDSCAETSMPPTDGVDYGKKCDTYAAAARCHQALEVALADQHETLQELIGRLRDYQNKLGDWRSLQDEIARNTISVLERSAYALVYDYFMYGALEGVQCLWLLSPTKKKYLQCTLQDYLLYEESKQKKKAEMAEKGTKCSEYDYMTANYISVQEGEDEPVDDYVAYAYVEGQTKTAGETALAVFESLVQKNAERNGTFWLRPLHPPKYSIDQTSIVALLSEPLHLSPGQTHPLPWYPPFCHLLMKETQESFHLDCCDHLLSVRRAQKTGTSDWAPDSEMETLLLKLAGTGAEGSAAEVGQRIRTLIQYNIGPRWLLLNLAAMYWRTTGSPAEALTCLRYALHAGKEEVTRSEDVALAQMSWLVLQTTRRVGDAVELARHAVAADGSEPTGHFLLSWLLSQQGNWTGAEAHALQTLRLEPEYPKATDLLKLARCRVKFPQPAEVPTTPPPAKKSTGLKTAKQAPQCSQMQDEAGPVQLSDLVKPSGKLVCFADPSGNSQKRCFMDNQIQLVPRAIFESLSRKAADCLAAAVHAGAGTPDMQVDVLDALAECGDLAALDELDAVQRHIERVLADATNNKGSAQASTLELSLHDDSYTEGPIDDDGFASVAGSPDNVALPPMTEREDEPPPLPSDRASLLMHNRALDDVSPEIIPLPEEEVTRRGAGLYSTPNPETCSYWLAKVKLDQPTSTWLAPSAKGIQGLQDIIDFTEDVSSLTSGISPHCHFSASSAWMMDHLPAARVSEQHFAAYRPEKALGNTFLSVSQAQGDDVEMLATRIALALKRQFAKDVSSEAAWTLSNLAALYWRTQGNAPEAIRCLRHSLHYAPVEYKDIPYISLANIYQQAGFMRSALITAGSALYLSPQFVVVHFTLANIYAALGDFDHAALMYFSTLGLQNNFDPARDRLHAVYCLHGRLPEMPPLGME